MLSDVELPMPDDDDVTLARYLAGLDALAPPGRRRPLAHPGHGEPTDRPMARLDADRRYLDDLLAGRTSTDEANRCTGHVGTARGQSRSGSQNGRS